MTGVLYLIKVSQLYSGVVIMVYGQPCVRTQPKTTTCTKKGGVFLYLYHAEELGSTYLLLPGACLKQINTCKKLEYTVLPHWRLVV